MKRFALVAFALAGCTQSTSEVANTADTNVTGNTPTPIAAEERDTIAACTQRGIDYFKEIGSYPTLSSAPNAGRLASEVAAERCGRTLTAF